jgi:predicted O-methyltransferase YrrM
MKLKTPDSRFLLVLAVIFLASVAVSVFSGTLVWLLAAAGLLVFVSIVVQIEIYRRIEPHVTAQVENYRQLESLFSLFATVKVDAPLPFLRGWAISPDMATILVSLIRETRPNCIVEAGSGASTILSSYCLKEAGNGKMFSLDQDSQFGRKTMEALRRHGLQDIATVVHAPLKDLTLGDRKYTWYDTGCVGELPRIDLLVIDGPPEFLHELARYPALPVLFEKLSPNAVVLIDDAADSCNRRIVDLWMKEFPVFEKEWIDTEKGTVILRRK